MHLQQLQRAVACVTDAVLVVGAGGYRPAGSPHQLTLGDGTPVQLSGAGRICLAVRQLYHIVPPSAAPAHWLVEVAAYYYTIEDADRREILAYHWHPDVPQAAFPHLHVSHGAVQRELLARADLPLSHNALRADLAKAHLPTRRISLAAVLRMAITQFGVTPRRADRQEVLRTAEE